MVVTDRTAKPDRASVNLSPAVRDALNSRLAELAAVEGRSATQEQLVGALLHGVPLWQLAVMLDTYIKQTASRNMDDG